MTASYGSYSSQIAPPHTEHYNTIIMIRAHERARGLWESTDA